MAYTQMVPTDSRSFSGLDTAARISLLLVGLAAARDVSFAQSPAPLYYAIEDESGEIIARGTSADGSVPVGQVFLPPGTFRYWVADIDALTIGSIAFEVESTAAGTEIPTAPLAESQTLDLDGDGLPDDIERVLGTNALEGDTDGDGVLDLAEIQQGLNPNGDSAFARTGVISSVEAPDRALQICAFDDLAVLTTRSGVYAFNVFNRLNPILLARIEDEGTPGQITCSGSRVGVAYGDAGFGIIDMSDPPSARLEHRVTLPGRTVAVASRGDLFYAGTNLGTVWVIDARSGSVLGSLVLAFGYEVETLAVAGDRLLAFQSNMVLSSMRIRGVQVALEDQYQHRFRQGSPPHRLVVGPRFIYLIGRLVFFTGVFRLHDGTILHVDDLELGGSGGVAGADARAPTGSGLAVWLPLNGVADLSFLRLLDLSTVPEFDADGRGDLGLGAVTSHMTLYNGLAYIASDTGLEIVSYLSADSLGVPPEVTLDPGLPRGQPEVEENRILTLTATVSDDVAVRNVEFWVDGERVATDGNFPFTHTIRVPEVEPGGALRLRARASDTGGNASETPELVLRVTADRTSPNLVVTRPTPGTPALAPSVVALGFDEAIDPASVVDPVVTIRPLGGGPQVVAQNARLEDADRTILAELDAPLDGGAYVAEVRAPITDRAGNRLRPGTRWVFWVVGGPGSTDLDGDGLPDELEEEFGFDPTLADSNGDGTPDGFEDHDVDGLSAAWELIFGTAPLDNDSDDNGIPDGAEDADGDGVHLSDELALGLDPFSFDSDGDGFDDGFERVAGFDPRVPGDVLLEVRSGPTSYINARLESPAEIELYSPEILYENR